MPEEYSHKTQCNKCFELSKAFDAIVDCTVATDYNTKHTFEKDENEADPKHCIHIVRVDICVDCQEKEKKKAGDLKFTASLASLEMNLQGLSGENASGCGNQDQQQSQGNDGSGGRGDHF
jgi:hypothetical protein